MAAQNGRKQTVAEIWPTQFLESVPSVSSASSRTALVILNSPFDDLEYFKRLYDHACYRLCVDGGANRLHDLLRKHYPSSDWLKALQHALPTAIHGDLDSLKDAVRLEYEKLGVPVTHDPDQYSTDFGKAVYKVLENVPDIEDLLVLGSLGGRVDQGVGLLHEIYREQKFNNPKLRFWLFTESNNGLIRRNIGILPLYGKAVISTKGLEWDVEEWPTEMGGQVSTSNHIVADVISVTTDVDVLFTVEREFGPKPGINHEETF